MTPRDPHTCEKGDEIGRSGAQLVTLREAASRLSICERSVRNLIASGRLRRVRIGRAVRIDLRDLAAFVERAKGRQTP